MVVSLYSWEGGGIIRDLSRKMIEVLDKRFASI